ncbi:MAG: hypothetical protein ACR2GY_03990 [Phycisphaerales bacterium]
MTNDEFEDETIQWLRPTEDDPALGELAVFGWLHYSDLREYRLRGRDALSPEERKTIARTVLFLKTDDEYQHDPAIISGTIARGSLGCMLAVLGCAIFAGVIYASSGSAYAASIGFMVPLIIGYLSWMLACYTWGAIRAKCIDQRYQPLPDTFWPFLDSRVEVEAFRFWPFADGDSYRAALANPPFLNGSPRCTT